MARVEIKNDTDTRRRAVIYVFLARTSGGTSHGVGTYITPNMAKTLIRKLQRALYGRPYKGGL